MASHAHLYPMLPLNLDISTLPWPHWLEICTCVVIGAVFCRPAALPRILLLSTCLLCAPQVRQYFSDSEFYAADVEKRGFCDEGSFECSSFSPSAATVKVQTHTYFRIYPQLRRSSVTDGWPVYFIGVLGFVFVCNVFSLRFIRSRVGKKPRHCSTCRAHFRHVYPLRLTK